MHIEGSSLHLTTSEAKWIVTNTVREATDLARAIARERRKIAAAYIPKSTFDGVVELHIDVDWDDPNRNEKLMEYTLAEVALEVAERGYGYNAADNELHMITVPFDEQHLPVLRRQAELKYANIHRITTNFSTVINNTERAFPGPDLIGAEQIPAGEHAKYNDQYFYDCMQELQVTAGIIGALDTLSKE